jgi:hypothetical protein
MTSRINNIKDNKLILRDYLGLINEIVHDIEWKIETVDDQHDKQELDNKINQMKSYKVIIKEYMNLNYANHFDDNDLYIIHTLVKRLEMVIQAYLNITHIRV